MSSRQDTCQEPPGIYNEITARQSDNVNHKDSFEIQKVEYTTDTDDDEYLNRKVSFEIEMKKFCHKRNIRSSTPAKTQVENKIRKVDLYGVAKKDNLRNKHLSLESEMIEDLEKLLCNEREMNRTYRENLLQKSQEIQNLNINLTVYKREMHCIEKLVSEIVCKIEKLKTQMTPIKRQADENIGCKANNQTHCYEKISFTANEKSVQSNLELYEECGVDNPNDQPWVKSKVDNTNTIQGLFEGNDLNNPNEQQSAGRQKYKTNIEPCEECDVDNANAQWLDESMADNTNVQLYEGDEMENLNVCQWEELKINNTNITICVRNDDVDNSDKQQWEKSIMYNKSALLFEENDIHVDSSDTEQWEECKMDSTTILPFEEDDVDSSDTEQWEECEMDSPNILALREDDVDSSDTEQWEECEIDSPNILPFGEDNVDSPADTEQWEECEMGSPNILPFGEDDVDSSADTEQWEECEMDSTNILLFREDDVDSSDTEQWEECEIDRTNILPFEEDDVHSSDTEQWEECEIDSTNILPFDEDDVVSPDTEKLEQYDMKNRNILLFEENDVDSSNRKQLGECEIYNTNMIVESVLEESDVDSSDIQLMDESNTANANILQLTKSDVDSSYIQQWGESNMDNTCIQQCEESKTGNSYMLLIDKSVVGCSDIQQWDDSDMKNVHVSRWDQNKINSINIQLCDESNADNTNIQLCEDVDNLQERHWDASGLDTSDLHMWEKNKKVGTNIQRCAERSVDNVNVHPLVDNVIVHPLVENRIVNTNIQLGEKQKVGDFNIQCQKSEVDGMNKFMNTRACDWIRMDKTMKTHLSDDSLELKMIIQQLCGNIEKIDSTNAQLFDAEVDKMHRARHSVHLIRDMQNKTSEDQKKQCVENRHVVYFHPSIEESATSNISCSNTLCSVDGTSFLNGLARNGNAKDNGYGVGNTCVICGVSCNFGSQQEKPVGIVLPMCRPTDNTYSTTSSVPSLEGDDHVQELYLVLRYHEPFGLPQNQAADTGAVQRNVRTATPVMVPSAIRQDRNTSSNGTFNSASGDCFREVASARPSKNAEVIERNPVVIQAACYVTSVKKVAETSVVHALENSVVTSAHPSENVEFTYRKTVVLVANCDDTSVKTVAETPRPNILENSGIVDQAGQIQSIDGSIRHVVYFHPSIQESATSNISCSNTLCSVEGTSFLNGLARNGNAKGNGYGVENTCVICGVSYNFASQQDKPVEIVLPMCRPTDNTYSTASSVPSLEGDNHFQELNLVLLRHEPFRLPQNQAADTGAVQRNVRTATPVMVPSAIRQDRNTSSNGTVNSASGDCFREVASARPPKIAEVIERTPVVIQPACYATSVKTVAETSVVHALENSEVTSAHQSANVEVTHRKTVVLAEKCDDTSVKTVAETPGPNTSENSGIVDQAGQIQSIDGSIRHGVHFQPPSQESTMNCNSSSISLCCPTWAEYTLSAKDRPTNDAVPVSGSMFGRICLRCLVSGNGSSQQDKPVGIVFPMRQPAENICSEGHSVILLGNHDHLQENNSFAVGRQTVTFSEQGTVELAAAHMNIRTSTVAMVPSATSEDGNTCPKTTVHSVGGGCVRDVTSAHPSENVEVTDRETVVLPGDCDATSVKTVVGSSGTRVSDNPEVTSGTNDERIQKNERFRSWQGNERL